MKLLRLILFLFLVSFSMSNFSQTSEHILHLDSLIFHLSNNPDVKDTKLFTQQYKDGSIKLQYLGVNYHSDSLDRYWETGQGCRYFDNGQLAGTATYDIKTHVLRDTSKIYLENGKLQRIMIWNPNYTKTFFMKTNTTCKYFPDSYRVIWYNDDSSVLKEQPYMYDFSKKGYKKHGVFKFYNSSGILILEKTYDMGKLMSKNKHK